MLKCYLLFCIIIELNKTLACNMRRKSVRQRSMSAYEFATDNDVIKSAAPPEKVVQELRDQYRSYHKVRSFDVIKLYQTKLTLTLIPPALYCSYCCRPHRTLSPEVRRHH